MGLEAVALGITQITAIVAIGVFLWQVFSRRFEAVDARFDNVDARFERIDAGFERIDAKFDKVAADMDARFDKVAADMGARFDKLEAKVQDLAKDHQSLARELSEYRGEMRARLDALASASSES